MLLAQLQSHAILPGKPLPDAFLAIGLSTIQAAIQWANELPYGRNSDRSDYRLVLQEYKGTCSTKHALIAALAAEQHYPLALQLGFFEMNAANTPQIKPVLAQYQIDSILEAHCFLKYEEECCFDITFPSRIKNISLNSFLDVERVYPEQIGKYKERRHKQKLNAWRIERALPLSSKALWQARECCIAQLG